MPSARNTCRWDEKIRAAARDSNAAKTNPANGHANASATTIPQVNSRDGQASGRFMKTFEF